LGLSTLEPTPLLPFLQTRTFTTGGFDDSPAWAHLRVAYGSGVSLREVASIATVVCTFASLPLPPRDVRRNFPRLVGWFDKNWEKVLPILQTVQLRDSNSCVIDGRRELHDRYQV
jgi:hypothetical protein